MHNDNILDFTRDMERVLYYPQPAGLRLEGFFADGVHPSEHAARKRSSHREALYPLWVSNLW